jgi:hypothetical protein
MTQDIKRLEVCLSQVRSKESACRRTLEKLHGERTTVAAVARGAGRDFDKLVQRLRDKPKNTTPAAARARVEFISKQMSAAKRRKHAAKERLSSLSEDTNRVGRELAGEITKRERLQEVLQCRKGQNSKDKECLEQEAVVEAVIAARIPKSSKSNNGRAHELVDADVPQQLLAIEKTNTEIPPLDPKVPAAELSQSGAQVTWVPISEQGPAGDAVGGRGGAIAGLIIRRIESLESWRTSLEHGISLHYRTNAGERVGLLVSGSTATGLVVALASDSCEETRKLKSDRQSIRRALMHAGLPVNEVLVADVSEEVAA